MKLTLHSNLAFGVYVTILLIAVAGISYYVFVTKNKPEEKIPHVSLETNVYTTDEIEQNIRNAYAEHISMATAPVEKLNRLLDACKKNFPEVAAYPGYRYAPLDGSRTNFMSLSNPTQPGEYENDFQLINNEIYLNISLIGKALQSVNTKLGEMVAITPNYGKNAEDEYSILLKYNQTNNECTKVSGSEITRKRLVPQSVGELATKNAKLDSEVAEHTKQFNPVYSWHIGDGGHIVLDGNASNVRKGFEFSYDTVTNTILSKKTYDIIIMF